MQFPPKKLDDPQLSSPQEIKPVTADHFEGLEQQPVPTTLDGGLVLVRTELGLAEIAKRSMQLDFRHRIMLMQIDDFSAASRYFSSFGGSGAQILQNLLDEGFIERR
jgi:hypothetical protein